MQWQRSMFGTTKAEIQRVRSQLDVVWRQPNSENTTATYHLLMSQLDSLLSREEAFWKQRSKVSWLKEGDRNTRFFHQRASNRKQRNYVKGLRDNTGRWREDEQGLQSVVLDYFTHLFTSSASGSEGEIIDAVESRVTPDMNNLLLTDYCDAEIHEAVFQMYPTKAPGPDGMPPIFFQKYWHIVGSDVTRAIKDFLTSGRLLQKIISLMLSSYQR